MNVHLSPKLEAFVRARVKSGLYNNASEVVREALRLLLARQEEDRQKRGALREAVAAGFASGPARDFSFAETNARLDKEPARKRARG